MSKPINHTSKLDFGNGSKPIEDHATFNIPLNGYDLPGTAKTENIPLHYLVGRDSFIKNFVEKLISGQGKNSSYLVGGFRGAGKTLAVNRVLDIYTKGKDRPSKRSWLLRNGYQKIDEIICKFTCFTKINLDRWYFLVQNRWENDNTIPKFSQAMYQFCVPIFKFFTSNKRLLNWLLWVFLPLALISLLPINYFQLNPNSFISWPWIVTLLITINSLLIHIWIFYEINLFQLPNLFKRIFKPVVIVRVNLSYTPLDSKDILFNLVSLLREQIRNSLFYWPRKIFQWTVFLFLGAVLSNWRYVHHSIPLLRQGV